MRPEKRKNVLLEMLDAKGSGSDIGVNETKWTVGTKKKEKHATVKYRTGEILKRT